MSNHRPRLAMAVCLVLCAAGGCRSPIAKQGDELTQLLQKYRERSAELASHDAVLLPAGVDKLLVEQTPDGPVVTMETEYAFVAPLVRYILRKASVDYLFESSEPAGRITARFTKMPMLLALNSILQRVGYAAVERDRAILIKPISPEGSTPGQVVSVGYLDANSVSSLLKTQFGSDLSFTVQPVTNTVLLGGAPEVVARAADLIHREDVPPQHVVLEALVVAFSEEDLRQLDINLARGSRGQYSDILAAFGSLTGDSFRFTRTQGDNRPLSYTAFVQALESVERARIVARPFIAARSGDAATIEVTRERQVIVERIQEGMAFTNTTAAKSGVILRITPTVLASGEVRVVMEVEQSQFFPTAGNVAIEVGRNRATTTMVVGDGETIVIGGLATKNRSDLNSGVPGLRRVPILNLLFGQQSFSAREEQVAILVTPHIWKPEFVPPIEDPERFTPPSTDVFPRKKTQ